MRKLKKITRRIMKRTLHFFDFLFTKRQPIYTQKQKKLKRPKKMRYFLKNQILTTRHFNKLYISTTKSTETTCTEWLFHKNVPFVNNRHFYFQPILKFKKITTTKRCIRKPMNVVNYIKIKLLAYFKTGNLLNWFFLLKLLPATYLFRCIVFKPFLNLNSQKIHLKKTNNLVYNNFYSYLLLSVNRNSSFYVTVKDTSSSAYFYMKYLLAYIESLFRIKSCIGFYSYSSFTFLTTTVQKLLGFYVFPVLKKFHRKFFVNDFISVLSIMFVQRNCLVFVRWLIRFIEKIHIRLHKKFFFLLNLYFRRIHSLNSPYLNYKGFKLTLRGKISSAGNSKKKIFKFSHGTCSLTKKNHKINYCHKIIRTYTGALGLKVFLFY